MTKDKKGLYIKLATCVVAIVGGLLLGPATTRSIFLGAIDLISTFGIAVWLIILAEQFKER